MNAASKPLGMQPLQGSLHCTCGAESCHVVVAQNDCDLVVFNAEAPDVFPAQRIVLPGNIRVCTETESPNESDIWRSIERGPEFVTPCACDIDDCEVGVLQTIRHDGRRIMAILGARIPHSRQHSYAVIHLPEKAALCERVGGA